MEIITVSPWIPLWKWTSGETGVEENEAGCTASLTRGDFMRCQRPQAAGVPSTQPKTKVLDFAQHITVYKLTTSSGPRSNPTS